MKYSLKIKWEENWITQPLRGEVLPDNGTYIPLDGSSPNQHLKKYFIYLLREKEKDQRAGRGVGNQKETPL